MMCPVFLLIGIVDNNKKEKNQPDERNNKRTRIRQSVLTLIALRGKIDEIDNDLLSEKQIAAQPTHKKPSCIKENRREV